MTDPNPPALTTSEWASFGLQVTGELHEGKQSRVFSATTADGQQLAVKLTIAAFADLAVLTERMRLVETLAADVVEVVGPKRLDGALVCAAGGWLVTATPLIDGEHLDSDHLASGHLDSGAVNDARVMGQTLGRLHRELVRQPAFAIPEVAALRLDRPTTDHVDSVDAADSARHADPATRSGWQLLHGDLSDRNLIRTEAGVRIIDFDDCGYGPTTYDIANSLYMVQFDATINGRPDQYRRFRPAFLDGYQDEADRQTDVDAVDAMITTRVAALGYWLDNLAVAPIGIRTATSAWRDTLRDFVNQHRDSGGKKFSGS